MATVMRQKELKHRRQRREKLHTLRRHYSIAKTEDEKTLILQKVKAIANWLSEEEFLAPLSRKAAAQ